ncbi:hypothetical protein MUU47_21745 [Scandinavium sp. H11S7]|uniref:Uncharacterized protein n=1 Tax=Scandinavium hiltneri TaxID=2926519 RepID=A0ABT2E751_9ENTR|nr:hypothetical protein [Scandinavium hiltneri]MCS2163699.1 hypothetical protein [Scandinavium hiltneri]
MKRLIISAALMAVSAGVMANTFQCSGNGLSNRVEEWEGLNNIKINGMFFNATGTASRLKHGTNEQLFKSEYPSVRAFTVFYNDSGDIYAVADVTGLADSQGLITGANIEAHKTICPAWEQQKQAEQEERNAAQQEREEAARAKEIARKEAEEQAEYKAILKHAVDEAAKAKAKEEAARSW